MGLWLKCPECQELNAPAAKECSACGASLSNLPREKRVYYFGPAPAPRTTEAPAAAAPFPAAAVSPVPAIREEVPEAGPEAAPPPEGTPPAGNHPPKKGKAKGGRKKKK